MPIAGRPAGAARAGCRAGRTTARSRCCTASPTISPRRSTSTSSSELRSAVGAVAPSVVRALPALRRRAAGLGRRTTSARRSSASCAASPRSPRCSPRSPAGPARCCSSSTTANGPTPSPSRLFNEMFTPRRAGAPRADRRVPFGRGAAIARAAAHPVRAVGAPRPVVRRRDDDARRVDGRPGAGRRRSTSCCGSPTATRSWVPRCCAAWSRPARWLRDSAGWAVDADRLEDVQAARRSAAFLVRRLELLSDDALQLLSVGAVLGKQFDLDVAVEVAGASGRRARHHRERAAQPAAVDRRDQRAVAVLPRQDPRGADRPARPGRATRAAQPCGRRVWPRAPTEDPDGFVFDLAYHLDAAGRHADALPHALSGAALARERYALDTAVVALPDGRARGPPTTTSRHGWSIAEGLGDVLTLQGVYAEAAEQIRLARSMVDDVTHSAALETKLGELAFKSGDIAGAKAHLEGALSQLGRRVPRHNARLPRPRAVGGARPDRPHAVARGWRVGRRHERPRRATSSRCGSTAGSRTCTGSTAAGSPCAWAHLRGLNLAERYGPSAELGQSYSEHAPVMTTLPWYSRGKQYVARSLEIRRELGDVWGQGQSLELHRGRALRGRHWARAREAAERRSRCSNAPVTSGRSTPPAGISRCATGAPVTLAEAADTGREVFRSASAIGDLTSAGIGFSIWTRATHGARRPAPGRRSARARQRGRAHHAELHLAPASPTGTDGRSRGGRTQPARAACTSCTRRGCARSTSRRCSRGTRRCCAKSPRRCRR